MRKVSKSMGRNPVLPPEVCIPDAEAHVFHGKLYAYGSYDLPDTEKGFYCSEVYHVASTSDMLTWEVGEKALDGKDIPWPDERKKKKYYVQDKPHVRHQCGGREQVFTLPQAGRHAHLCACGI